MDSQPSNTQKAHTGAGFVNFLGFHRRLAKPKDWPEDKRFNPVHGEYRVYEGYWSSLIAKGLPGWRVLAWVLKRSLNPLKSLKASWRAHQRLKLAYLFRLQRENSADTRTRSVYSDLAKAYHDYEGSQACRDHPKGDFKQFHQSYIDKSNQISYADKTLAKSIAQTWRKRFTSSQWKIQIGIITFLAGISGLIGAVVFAVGPFLMQQALNLIGQPVLENVIPQSLPDVWIGWIWLFVFAIALLCIGVASFLKNNLSDVVFWTAREGQSELYDNRDQIRETAIDTIRHVLLDEDCDRVVIIAHSLGTSVAYEALLEIGRRRKAMPTDVSPEMRAARSAYPYEKISHFITAGSPIETIHYFFNLLDSASHRYNRIANTLRGSVEDPPFKIGKTQEIKWLNLSARADPISSQLFLPGEDRPPTIEEVETVSQYQPHPVKAHSGYFSTPTSVARMFQTIMLGPKEALTPPKTYSFAKPLARFGVLALHTSLAVIAWTLFIAGVASVAALKFDPDTMATIKEISLAVMLFANLLIVNIWFALFQLNHLAPLSLKGQARAFAKLPRRGIGGWLDRWLTAHPHP